MPRPAHGAMLRTTLIACAVVDAAATVAPAAADAQAPAAAAAAPARGAVRGVALDSLTGRPLAGAAVFVEGTARTAAADSAGRFVLDSVPAGPQVVSVTHAVLEEAGLDGLAAPVTVVAGGAADVRLATPSRRTLWGRLCPGPWPGDRVGALFGEVRDAATGAHVAGARAAVAWTAVSRHGRRLGVGRGAAAATTDSLGTYRLCGVPLDAELAVDAAAGPLDSARAQVTLVGQPYARVDLWVGGAAAPAGASDEGGAGAERATAAGGTAPGDAPARPAPARGTAALVGVVRDTLGAPRRGARVTVDGVEGREAVTDADGRFRLAGLPAGTRPVVVRALGFAPQVVNVALRPRRDAEVAVALARVVRLARVTARAARSPATSRLFDDIARRRRVGFASVIDSTTIQRWPQLRTAIQQLPFVRLGSVGAGVWGLVAPNTGCVMPVAVDRRLADWEEVVDLPPDYVLAVEVYRRPQQVPAELQGLLAQAAGMGRPACGLALVWTRSAR